MLKKLFAARELFMVVLIIAAVIILTILSKNFLTVPNLVSVMVGIVPNAIIAIGMTLCLVEGMFDLSCGGVMAFCGTLVGVLMLKGVSIPVAVILTLLVGILVGIINGFFVACSHC